MLMQLKTEWWHAPSLMLCCWSAQYKFENKRLDLIHGHNEWSHCHNTWKTLPGARKQSCGQTQTQLPHAYIHRFVVLIVQLSALSSRLHKPEPKDNNVTLVKWIREKPPVLSEHVNNFVLTTVPFHLSLTCSTCVVLSKKSVDHSAVQLHSIPLPHHQPSRHKVLFQSVCNRLQPWKRPH